MLKLHITLRLNSLMLLLLCSLNCLAATPPASNTIEVESNEAIWDQEKQQATHHGNVVMKQGPRLLRADKLTITRGADGTIEMLVATGHPATIEGTLPDDTTTQTVSGQANTIYFYPTEEKLVLKEAAQLKQGAHLFTGPEVAFDFNGKQVTAQGNKQHRPTLIYQFEKS